MFEIRMLHVSWFSNCRGRILEDPWPVALESWCVSRSQDVTRCLGNENRLLRFTCALHVRRQPGGMCRMAVFQIFNMLLHLLDLHQSCYSLHVDVPTWRLARIMVSPNQRKLDHFSIETDGFGDPVFKKPPFGFSHFLLGVSVSWSWEDPHLVDQLWTLGVPKCVTCPCLIRGDVKWKADFLDSKRGRSSKSSLYKSERPGITWRFLMKRKWIKLVLASFLVFL